MSKTKAFASLLVALPLMLALASPVLAATWQTVETWEDYVNKYMEWQTVETWTDSLNAILIVGQPELISPDNDSTIYDNTPTFQWFTGTNATNHRFLLDNDEAFSSPVENILLGGTTTTYTVTTPLADDNYWWKVIATGGGLENSSAVWTFELTTPVAKEWYDVEIWGDFIDSSILVEGWLAGWGYRMKITINHDNVDAPLYNFPAMIYLDSTYENFWGHCDSEQNIAFTSSDGTTKLKREIELFDHTDDNLYAHVKVPYLSSTVDTDIYIYYDSGSHGQTNDTDTWGSDFAGVWHLSEDPAGNSFTTTETKNGGMLGQGVATDGENIWLSAHSKGSNGQIVKYAENWDILENRINCNNDGPGIQTQINSLFYKDGILYVGANNWPTTTPKKGWVLEYYADNLEYITYHTVGGEGVAFWQEGIGFRGGSFWLVMCDQQKTAEYDTDWNWVTDHDLPFSAPSGLGYQGVVWIGDYAYFNIHGVSSPDTCDLYYWNGSAFEAVERIAHPEYPSLEYCGQDIAYDPNTGEMLWSSNYFVRSSITGPVWNGAEDSTFHNNDGTFNGSMTTEDQVAGKIDGSLDFDGTNDHLNMGAQSSLQITGDLTISIWVKADSFPDPGYNRILNCTGTTETEGVNDIYDLAIDSDGHLKVFHEYGAGNNEGWYTSTSVFVELDTWVHLGVVRDSSVTEWKLYKNGSYVETLDFTNNATGGTSSVMTIGIDADSLGYPWDGIIDEVRISDTTRSTGWISTTFNNQSDPATFYTVGGEESIEAPPEWTEVETWGNTINAEVPELQEVETWTDYVESTEEWVPPGLSNEDLWAMFAIRILFIFGPLGVVAWNFTKIKDPETGVRAVGAVAICFIGIIVLWFVADAIQLMLASV